MSQNQESKGQKVGADGLTKKQRRALKVNAKVAESKKEEIKNTTNNETQNKTEIKANNDTNIDHKSKENVPSSKDKIKEPVSNREIKENNTPSDIVQVSNQDKENKSNKDEGFSKSELRAQRRAIQEAQRLAKQKQQENKVNEKPTPSKGEPKTLNKLQLEQKPKSDLPQKVAQKIVQPKVGKVQLFSHLTVATKEKGSAVENKVHPAFIRLGAQYASKTILGSNARCLALLAALKNLISNFESPPEQEFCRSLEVALQNSVQYLQKCRLLAVSMTNALRCFKLILADVNTNLSDSEKRDSLIKCIEDYIHDEIAKASEAISMKVEKKISNGDTILTYGCSSLVLRILLEAYTKSKKQFKVIVVDANPLFEGKEMLRRLVNAGIECSYVLINAASFIMNKATKVLLGAHALLANGYVMSRIGTAQIALIAKTYNKPVLVCCETYKFCERVQTDSIVYNEIGYPGELLRVSDKQQLDDTNSKLNLLNLMYDVTPPDLVTLVATEIAFLPCTSVPVILRIDLEKTKK